MPNHRLAFLSFCHAIICSIFQALMAKDCHCCHFCIFFIFKYWVKKEFLAVLIPTGQEGTTPSPKEVPVLHALLVTGTKGAYDSRLISGLICIFWTKKHPLLGFFVEVHFPSKFTRITRIESSHQIFIHAFNLKELMSPLCHLCCSMQQAKKLITWITRVWRTQRRWQSSFPFWVPTELHCCALQVCLGLYLTQEAPAPISAAAQLQQKGTRPKEALLLPADENSAPVCLDP